MAALFRAEPETAPKAETPSVARSVHDISSTMTGSRVFSRETSCLIPASSWETRHLSSAQRPPGRALAVFAGVDVAKATTREARWAYAEWLALAKRRFHEARRMRQAGDIDGALAVFAGVDVAKATTREARWAYAEWLALAKRRFGDRDALVYSQGAGRAAALAPRADGALEVVAAMGMPWQAGKVVSRRSLRGLKPLTKGGASWS